MKVRFYAVLLLAATFLAGGLATGVSVYYLLSFMLFGVCFYALFSAFLTLLAVRVQLCSQGHTARRGESRMIQVKLHNGSPLPAGEIRVSVTVPDSYETQREIITDVAPLRTGVFRTRIECEHRGVYEIGLNRLWVEDLFGLVCLRKSFHTPGLELKVLPAYLETTPAYAAGGEQENLWWARRTSDPADPGDLRDWTEGDPMKRIQWKLYLKRRELLVRGYEESFSPESLILPDLTKMEGTSEERLCGEDLVCEAALAVARAHLRRGETVRMPLTGEHPAEITGEGISDLARFEEALTQVRFDSPFPFSQVLETVMSRGFRTNGLVLITAELNLSLADRALRTGLNASSIRIIQIGNGGEDEVTGQLRSIGIRVDVLDLWQSRSDRGRMEAF